MISEKKGKYPFLALIALIKKVSTGGAYWTLDQKLTYFFYMFGVDGLKSFIIQDDKKVIEKYYLGQNN